MASFLRDLIRERSCFSELGQRKGVCICASVGEEGSGTSLSPFGKDWVCIRAGGGGGGQGHLSSNPAL